MKKVLTISLLLVLANSVFSQVVTNPDTVCVGSTEYYKVPKTAGSTYTWGIYHGSGTIIPSATTDSINIAWSNTAGLDSIWVFEINAGNCKGDTAKLKVARVAKPTAQFDNATLCSGTVLNVSFTGYSPFSLEYTRNGNSIVQSGITQNPYTIGSQSGNYQIIKITDRNCVNTTLSGTINSVIAQPLNTLQIIHK